MDLVSQFVAKYRKEVDFYEQACRIVQQLLDSKLQSAGIRSIVSSRAKNPKRLEEKLRQRDGKKHYASSEQIYDDIVDLAGVRVALYFPGEASKVNQIIQSALALLSKPKVFPDDSVAPYKKRFTGYGATHYRVRIPEQVLSDSQRRYADARIEVQVASVLMHAWSEVEHDLVYKPLQGQLSEDEYAILDELNGLVLAGEIALERLQRAVELRLKKGDQVYENHYELGVSLVELAREKLNREDVTHTEIGRVDLLFQLLLALGLNTREKLARYVSSLHEDFERRPLAEQAIDSVLSEDTSRYEKFNAIRFADEVVQNVGNDVPLPRSRNAAIGEFMSAWIDYERLVQSMSAGINATSLGIPSVRLLKSVSGLTKEERETAERLRRYRNLLVHGIEIPDLESMSAATSDLHVLVERLKELNQKLGKQ